MSYFIRCDGCGAEGRTMDDDWYELKKRHNIVGGKDICPDCAARFLNAAPARPAAPQPPPSRSPT